MAFAQVLTPQAAQALGLSVIEVALTNWGNRGATADINSLQFPVAGQQDLSSIAAIAIAPRSEVDRCVIRFTPGPTLVYIPAVPQNYLLRDDEFEVSVNAPALVSTPGPITIRAHETSWFSDTYVPFNAVTDVAFGGAQSKFRLPTLRLLLYFRTPIGVPARAPFYFPDGSNITNFLPGATLAVGAVSTEQLLCIVPMSGRGHVQFSARPAPGAVFPATTDAIVSLRYTAIDVMNIDGIFATNNTCERQLGQTLGVDAATGKIADFAQPITAQYFAVYFTIVSMTGNPATLQWFLRATDCCDGRTYITPSTIS
ncbi:MAG: hypothetical protein ACREJC_02675 [Tepidisphaeraceae bacterium]